MKKLALLVYPACSLQEVMNLSRLFRWDYDMETEVISSSLAPVKSEEGILLQPQKTTEQFRIEDYGCLILPGCSDFTEVFRDNRLLEFLRTFQNNHTFPIGAICGGPMLLAKAGLLKGKPFTASIYMDFFDFCPFMEKENYVPAPLVTADHIVTAGGGNFNGFAVAMARLLGFECPDRILSGYMDDWAKEDYEVYLPPEAVEEVKAAFCAGTM